MAELWIAPTLGAALDRMADDPGARPIAGGVGVLLARTLGGVAVGERWVGVGSLPALGDDGDGVVGAATTLEAVARRAVPLLSAIAGGIANPGIRVIGTVGGNVVAGGAASEMAVGLVALGARARLASAAGERWVAVEDLDVGPGELVLAFEIPREPVRWGWQRLTLHGAMDRSSASIAVAVGGEGARVVVGCAASRLLRLPAAEAAVAGGRLAEVHEAAAADLAGVGLLEDDRASGEYRRRVILVLVERAARAALER